MTVKAEVASKVPPFKVRVPVPAAALLPKRKTPLVRVRPPEKVLAPERVSWLL